LIVWDYLGGYLAAIPDDLPELARRCDSLAIGNGLTKKPEVLQTVKTIIASWRKPLVIDADAILPGLKTVSRQVVYTPHILEFQRLSGAAPSQDLQQRKEQVKALAGKLEAAVLLKGKTDVISDGKEILTNATGNAGMTAGGTGDTLAGICATFLAQGYTPLQAAFNAAYINGAAGDLAFKKYGYSLLASDLIAEIPQVLKKLRK
jgi:NAD(P)H-hydrate epimerase